MGLRRGRFAESSRADGIGRPAHSAHRRAARAGAAVLAAVGGAWTVGIPTRAAAASVEVFRVEEAIAEWFGPSPGGARVYVIAAVRFLDGRGSTRTYATAFITTCSSSCSPVSDPRFHLVPNADFKTHMGVVSASLVVRNALGTNSATWHDFVAFPPGGASAVPFCGIPVTPDRTRSGPAVSAEVFRPTQFEAAVSGQRVTNGALMTNGLGVLYQALVVGVPDSSLSPLLHDC